MRSPSALRVTKRWIIKNHHDEFLIGFFANGKARWRTSSAWAPKQSSTRPKTSPASLFRRWRMSAPHITAIAAKRKAPK